MFRISSLASFVCRRSMFLFCFGRCCAPNAERCESMTSYVWKHFHRAHIQSQRCSFNFFYVEDILAVRIQRRILAKHRTDILKITHKYLGWLQKIKIFKQKSLVKCLNYWKRVNNCPADVHESKFNWEALWKVNKFQKRPIQAPKVLRVFLFLKCGISSWCCEFREATWTNS